MMNGIKKLYAIVYVRFYLLIKSLGEESIPRFNTMLLLSLFGILNTISLISIIMIFSKGVFIVDQPMILFGLGLLIIGANSIIIFGKKRYIVFESKYSEGTTIQHRKNTIFFWGYVIFSIVFLAIALIFLNYYPIIKR